MNFNTTNSTLRQLLGNGLSYRVPMFQRDYSWGPDEWDDLWQDIVAVVDEEDAEPAHYMGYLVLQSTNNRAFDIIDGQQRMTTLSVLILTAVAHLMDLSTLEGADSSQRRRADQLRSSYIGYLDPVSLVSQTKLTLNRNNDRFYQNYLVPLEPLPKKGLNASENLLRQAFVWFKERIKKESGKNGATVARFIDSLVDKLFFTVITVTDELNAFTVFETLNSRGVRLSATDLLKNYLFAVVSRDKPHEREIKTLEDLWDSIVDLLGSDQFPEFLRIFWNSRNRLVRKADLFKVIRNATRDRQEAFTLIRQMKTSAQVYVALRRPEESSDDWKPEERKSLKQLKMFNVRQPLALLLAVFERFGEQDRSSFQKLLRAITVLSFRYNVICGRQSKEQEGIYNQIAQEISSCKVENINEALVKLRPVYPEDEEFRAAFEEKALRTISHRNNKVVRFILFQLEEHLSGTAFEIESSRYSIEHILPENPSDDEWCQFSEQQEEAFTYRLGNMTLLEANHNRDLGHSGYDEKRLTYRKSDFAMTRNLADKYDRWTVEKICANQRWMAKQATSIWRVNFP